MTKSEILARLDERRASMLASPWAADKFNRDAIQRTLDALDSPYSYYVALTAEEREKVRVEWTNLAAHLGLKLAPKRATRAAPALPAKVQAFFHEAACIPYRPRASNDSKKTGMRSTSWERAQNLREVELNPPGQIYWLTFDCDHDNPGRWKTAGLLEPAFITINQATGRHHVAYRLTAPVCRSERARAHPLRFLRAVREGLRLALDGDASYVGLLTKNPLHPAWQTIRPESMPSYTLAQLAETIDLRRAVARKRTSSWTGLQINMSEVEVGSRNRALFDQVRSWARQNPGSLEDMLETAERYNAQLRQPLGFNEVKSIVNSIERYILGRHKNSVTAGSHAAFIKAQRARGRLGGRPATTLTTQPWRATGMSRSTWYQQQAAPLNHPKIERGRPTTTKDSKPWLEQGISRATWYRQQKKLNGSEQV